MPDPKPPVSEKGTRPRPFGPFLLFLTVLVVVLIAWTALPTEDGVMLVCRCISLDFT